MFTFLVIFKLIQSSGLDSILSRADLLTSETSTIVDVNDLKHTRKCIQVATCSIYELLKKRIQKMVVKSLSLTG